MAAKLTIVGLGQVGASVGLALAKYPDKITRFGHDREPPVARRAQALGAVDRIVHNLPSAVEGANIILLALPFDQVLDTLKVIAPVLQEKTVVMDTAPLKAVIAGWMKEYLPPTCYYVGLAPAVNPIYLEETGTGVEAAHADLFSYGIMGISSPPGTIGEAVKLASDLATFLGAKPFFIDLAESDGFMTALHILPQVSASALVNMCTGRPGWADSRKFAGRHFASGTLPVHSGDEAKALARAALHHQSNLLTVLDEYIARLQQFREAVASGDQKETSKWFENARLERKKWLQERTSGDWLAIDHKVVNVPKQGVGKRLFGDLGKLFAPPKPRSRDDNEENGK